MRDFHETVSSTRLAAVGMLAVAVVVAAGLITERLRFGAAPAVSEARVRREVGRALQERARRLRSVAEQLAGLPELAEALGEGPNGARRLFALLERTGQVERSPETSVTLYDADAQVLAWTGRPSTLSAERLAGPSALFVAPGPLGLRLVHVEPVIGLTDRRQIGAVAAESVLSSAYGVPPGATDDYTFETSLVPVSLVPGFARSGQRSDLDAVVLRGTTGEPLLEVGVDRTLIGRARQRWRATTVTAAAWALAGALLLLGAPVAAWRAHGGLRRFLAGTVALCAVCGIARLLVWWNLPPALAEASVIRSDAFDAWWTRALLRTPTDLLANGLLALGLVGIAGTTVDRAQLWCRPRRADPFSSPLAVLSFFSSQVLVGTVVAALVAAFEAVLRVIVSHATIDVLHLSLHPYDYPRLALLIGLVLLHASVLWGAAVILLAGLARWRVRRTSMRLTTLACWVAPSAAFVLFSVWRGWELSREPLLLTTAAAGVAALAWRRGAPWIRHGSQARRVAVASLALVVPSILLYPSLADVADRAKTRLITERFAVETLAHPRTLLAHLDEALQDVDAIPRLADLVLAAPEALVQTDTAFAVWRRTALADWRLTSAVEMYDAAGRLFSRFALNLPEYAPRTQRYRASTCHWDVFGEAAPLGAEERRILHAERGICDDDGRIVGALVLHVMLDYSTQSFISSQNPYFEIFRGSHSRREDLPGSDVALVIYGWGRTPVYTTTGQAWPLDDALFERLYRTNQGFWSSMSVNDARWHVYFVNDRNGIYALGYPVPTWFDHSVHLAELATLGAVAALAALLAASVLQRLAWREPWTGRQLMREIRTSFSRKLFLAFVAATIIPVLILALAIRAYVASRLHHDIEAEAARTAAVAQRVVEETLSLAGTGEIAPSALDDDALVLISRIIDQDVNVYLGSQLAATSERDLFASGQLPTRTPAAVYRAIAIDRLPSYVGEDEIAGLRYLMAAAPVRAADRDAVLTVPFTLRQRQIEREIDELDRGVQLGAIAFILLGAAIGYWMAERISDPVQRLTRASRRIAAGDLETRVFLRSADELRRLVESFNKMAWELQRQRAQLERTNRLEAWAEMARQVAHDIKNPLTPIQLSAEHLRRVHRDRGQPMSPVLDACVDTILAQVRLLRQIAGEFSSFASTPVPRPVRTSIGELLKEVVDSYATGLAGRVNIEIAVAPDVPDLDIDRTLIGRAVTNVVENALHAMPAGGTLTIRVAAEGAGVTVSIADTGVGLDREAQERIFEPYFSTKATGTGLGLTIAKRNVELHGGTIHIASTRGKGTTVTFRLPGGVSPATLLSQAGPAAPAPP
jgi:signal transduction histidine kinase